MKEASYKKVKNQGEPNRSSDGDSSVQTNRLKHKHKFNNNFRKRHILSLVLVGVSGFIINFPHFFNYSPQIEVLNNHTNQVDTKV